MSDLEKKKCTPCVVETPTLKGKDLNPFYMQLNKGWEIKDEHHLKKLYSFKNFKEGLSFVNIIGHIAEEEGHHPEILLTWGKVEVKIWTHKVNGLTENDFILAAKVEAEFISHQG